MSTPNEEHLYFQCCFALPGTVHWRTGTGFVNLDHRRYAGANDTFTCGIDGGHLLVDFRGSIVVGHEGFSYVADMGDKDSEVRFINRT